MRIVDDLLRPFTGYIPASEFGHRVVGPAAVMMSAEQREVAREDPLSFRHAAGRRAKQPKEEVIDWLESCRNQGVVLPVGPAGIIYRQQKGDFSATGIIGELSLDAYKSGRVRRHEKTITKTELKMAEYMRRTRIYGNPPVMAFRPNATIEADLAEYTRREHDTAFTSVNGNFHQLWTVPGDAAAELCGKLDDPLYIMDGHHRLAAASLLATEEGRDGARMPAGVFPAGELRLRSFARCVVDSELDTERAIRRLRSELELEEVGEFEARPSGRFEFGARIGNKFFRIRIPRDLVPDDPYASLDVNLLQDLILGPVFGIRDPDLDKRLRFVADLKDSKHANIEAEVWILPHPVAASDVMAVADSGRAMPPKSTWFVPKLPSGLVIRPLDEL